MSGAGEGKGQPPKRRRGGRQAVRSALAAAETVVPPLQLPPGFERRADGFYRHQGEGKEAFRICGPFDVLAEFAPDVAALGDCYFAGGTGMAGRTNGSCRATC